MVSLNLPLPVRARAWLALLLLQATWSYRRLQSLGWIAVVRPAAQWADPVRSGALLGKLAIHFNTHPLLAPLLMGAALSELHPGRDPDETAEAMNRRLVRWMGTFGAIGDMLYWRALQWNLAWLAVVAWIVAGVPGVAFLAGLWFSAEVVGRITLFEIGLRRPDDIAVLTQRLAGHSLRLRLQQLALVGTCLAGGFAFGTLREFGPAGTLPELVGLLGAGLGLWLAVRTRLRSAVLWLPVLLAMLVHLLEWGG